MPIRGKSNLNLAIVDPWATPDMDMVTDRDPELDPIEVQVVDRGGDPVAVLGHRALDPNLRQFMSASFPAATPSNGIPIKSRSTIGKPGMLSDLNSIEVVELNWARFRFIAVAANFAFPLKCGNSSIRGDHFGSISDTLWM